jgi:hypothetical protein
MTTLNTNNAGRIGGSGTLDANVNNTGTIFAGNGTYEVTGTISGTGVLEADLGGDLRLDSNVTGQRVVFADPTGVLTVEKITGFVPTEIDGYGNGAAIDFDGQPNVLGNFNAANSTLSLTISGTVTPVATLKFGGVGVTYTAADFFLSDDGHGGTLLSAPPCFAAGTRILTVRGMVAVEDLRAGDRVINHAGEQAPIVWVGRRHTDCLRHSRPRDVWPVRIRAGAFGEDCPRRDLRLSPDHAVLVGASLVPARFLINGAGIVQERVAEVTYYHLELPRHDVISAEGLAVESFLDTGNRARFESDDAAVMLRAVEERSQGA